MIVCLKENFFNEEIIFNVVLSGQGKAYSDFWVSGTYMNTYTLKDTI